jgi:hypothetical protein
MPATSLGDLTTGQLAQLARFSGPAAAHECWPWLGKLDRYGYGRVASKVNGRIISTGAHRAAYLLRHGEIPDGLVIDHVCRNRACVNPAHMEPVTNQQNISPERRNYATHCRKGHPYSPDNTRLQGTRRLCKICTAERQRRWRERSTAA